MSSPETTLAAVPWGALVAAEAADEKAGRDTVVLDMVEALVVVDAFVITSGRNPRQVRTIVEEVERRVGSGEERVKPLRVEGLEDTTWVLMDYGEFVVHVFLDEAREYYDLEHLWARAPRVSWRTDAACSAT